MTINLTAWNNQRFQVSFDVSAWGVAYDLAASAWRFQARRTASSSVADLDIPEVGSAVFVDGIVSFSAPLAAVVDLSDDYVHDFGFIPPGGEFVRVDGGALTIVRGVTR